MSRLLVTNFAAFCGLVAAPGAHAPPVRPDLSRQPTLDGGDVQPASALDDMPRR